MRWRRPLAARVLRDLLLAHVLTGGSRSLILGYAGTWSRKSRPDPAPWQGKRP